MSPSTKCRPGDGVTRLRGLLSVERIEAGSKSERDALILHCGDESYVVRRVGDNPFEPSSLSHLAGQVVEAQGDIEGCNLYITRWSVLDSG